MLAQLVLLFILGLNETWRDDACDRPFADGNAETWCETKRDNGKAWAERLAGIIASESERSGIPAQWIAAVIAQESAFEQGNICPMSLSVSRIVSREVINADVGREKMCWTYRQYDGEQGTNCQPVLVLEEDDEFVKLDRCAYGEMGLMQIRPHEARAGQVVPATGQALPASRADRHLLLLDPQVNISLGVSAIEDARDECCGEDAECRADPARYIGMYNSGRCENERYVRNLKRKMRAGLGYACRADNTLAGCEGDD